MRSSRRSTVTMSEAEIADFLEQSRTAVLATSSPSGYPHLVAMWFLPVGPDIAVWAYGASQKVTNLRRDGRATLLVEAGETYETLRGVSIDASVEIVDDPDDVAVLGEKLNRRYSGGPAYSVGDAIGSGTVRQAHKRVGLILHPMRYRTWDHRKLSVTGVQTF